MKDKKYVYYSKGKIRLGSNFEFVLMSFILFLIVPIVALFECIWLKLSGKGKYITKKEYYTIKLKEIENA